MHLLAHWLDQHDGFAPVVARLQHAIEAYKNGHPDEDFALLHHREQTLRQRFQALFFAPLLGIETLTGFDTHEIRCGRSCGRGYHSATLTQFLGNWSHQCRRGAVTCVVAGNRGSDHLCRWAHDGVLGRKSMHQGKITMLGRIMAGSQAVISHDETGQAVYVAYYPPDLHLSQLILAYCERVALATGSDLFVIDRQ